MKLAALLSPWCAEHIPDCDIVDLQIDSRQIKSGCLFIAYPGYVTDGRFYIPQALALCAAAIVYEPKEFPKTVLLPKYIPCIPIVNLAQQLAAISSRFYTNPTQSLDVTGVTGTNGKTTIAYQLAQAHSLLSGSACYIGTLGQGYVDDLQPLNNTTPDALCLQRLFYNYKQHGVKYVSMEVSSHALDTHRVDNIAFTQAIFTNLTLDHLDYHHTMQAYADAKAQLFAMPTLQWSILNHDDSYSLHMNAKKPASCQTLTYGLQTGADVRATDCNFNFFGSDFAVDSPWGAQDLHVKSIGEFNIYNSLAVYSSLLAHNYPLEAIASVMAAINPSPGRMEIVAQEPCVLVDYAHTPDALNNVLTTITRLRSQQSITRQIWVVFGCGGDRDKSKRPIMGRIASQLADHIILTNDNPRTEDPASIIYEIRQGLLANISAQTILDRKEAIHKALTAAGKNDIILIAGKGHESYQQIGQQRFDFSDQQVVKDFLH